jgi:hypothetical protein
MGTFAETATVDDRLSFTNQGKLSFSVSICSKQTKLCLSRFPFAATK